MLNWLTTLVSRAVVLPAMPSLPDGSPELAKTFHAGRTYWRLGILSWLFTTLLQLIPVVALQVLLTTRGDQYTETVNFILRGVQILIVFVVTASLPFTYAARYLDYRLRWYVVTDRSLRIRYGIFTVRELTMTFANIQEIRVSAGLIQNFFGLADVEVHSAGGGSGEGPGQANTHVARFEHVDNATEIRDFLQQRLAAYRDMGLGHHDPKDPEADALLAARQVLFETRLLAQALGISKS